MAPRKKPAKQKASVSGTVAQAAQGRGETGMPTQATYDLSSLKELFRMFREVTDINEQRGILAAYLVGLRAKHGMEQFTVLMLYDERDQITNYHSNRIYQAASSAGKQKDLLLFVHSRGGSIEPAYLIGKTCQRLCKSRFHVVVPRKAKSAATLLSLGAHQIHMGLTSELGPIDPQIGGYPALSLANALGVLAEQAALHPQASNMLAEYLTKNLRLQDLGYFKRVGESAAQYAERLLANKAFPPERSAQFLANHFVNHYKDHGFVIDADEARDLLGQDVVKIDSPEYRFGNEMFQFLDLLSVGLELGLNKEFDWVGALETDLVIRDLRKKQ